MYKVEYTKEELDALMIQIGGRIDELKELQVTEAKRGDVKRVIEIENLMQPIVSGLRKMTDERYKR